MICKHCGAEFEPAHHMQRYCSQKCYDEHHGRKKGKEAICPQCGKAFIKAIGNEKYCSVECRTEALRDSTRSSNRESWRRTHKYIPPEKQKCVICGNEFTPRRTGQVTCSGNCRKKYVWYDGLTGAEREALKAQRRKEQAEAQRKPKPIKTYYHRQCKVCGEWFNTMNPAQQTCSKQCSKRAKYARKQHRIPKAQMIDKDITLEALYRRDSGVCYLCGGRCDWNDRDKEKNTVGASYPSIDHIIPIARGGLHAWNNVRLAHFKCNQEKGADLIDHAEELIPANAYEFKREIKVGKKQTEQYSLDGRLIAVYQSTAEAEKRTNVPQRGIQNCARGERKTYHGYVWRYRV